jgi:hypothetical protein
MRNNEYNLFYSLRSAYLFASYSLRTEYHCAPYMEVGCLVFYQKPGLGTDGFNPILHTAWLNNHALTLKRNTAKYYSGEKSKDTCRQDS